MSDPAQAVPDPPPLAELLAALAGTPPERGRPAEAAESGAAPAAEAAPADLAAQAERMDAWVRELRSGGGHTDFP